jgi:hypothetical protein
MSIIGFNFTKMNAEKGKPSSDKINISNNVSIVDVSENDFNLAPDQKSLRFNFEFTSKYQPDLGHIELCGEVIFLEQKAKAKEIMDGWKKNKRLEKELMLQVMNQILLKCNIQALILSQAVNLPPPMRLPSVTDEPPQQAQSAQPKPSKK